MARAVSLCLFNKIQVAQLYWPETAVTTRYSMQDGDSANRSPLVTLIRARSSPPVDLDLMGASIEPTTRLLEQHQSSSFDIESMFDGLLTLDETFLNDLTETDLISSNY